MTDPRRTLLQDQLDISWGFAQEHVLPRLDDDDVLLWEPSAHVCTVRRVDGRWRADWPDETREPLPEPTVGWLLWHIEWWWEQTLRSVDGLAPVPPEEHAWSGGTAGVLAAKQGWDRVLAEAHLDRTVRGLMPQPRPLAGVAAWVTVELTKNLAEIHQLLVRRSHDPAGPAGRGPAGD